MPYQLLKQNLRPTAQMPDTMAYPISFGDAKRAYPWSVLSDFIRIARAQYPQPV